MPDEVAMQCRACMRRAKVASNVATRLPPAVRPQRPLRSTSIKAVSSVALTSGQAGGASGIGAAFVVGVAVVAWVRPVRPRARLAPAVLRINVRRETGRGAAESDMG